MQKYTVTFTDGSTAIVTAKSFASAHLKARKIAAGRFVVSIKLRERDEFISSNTEFEYSLMGY